MLNIEYFFSFLSIKIFVSSFNFLYKKNIVIAPKYVIYDATRRCNLDCKHCRAKKGKYENELSTKQVKKLIDEISEYGVKQFSVTGGEPLLRDDLIEIFEYAKNKGLRTGLASNGFYINKINAKKLANVFDSIQISIDGSEEKHNQIRRNNQSYQKAINAIKCLQSEGVKKITIATVISKQNIEELDKLSKLVDEIHPSDWKLTAIICDDLVEKNYQKNNLNTKQFQTLLRFTIRNKKRLKIKFGENLGFLGDYDKKVRSQIFFCPIGYLSCCIGVDGYVRGCPEQRDCADNRQGNILDQNFADIWKQGFKKYRNKQRDNKCKKCIYVSNCLNKCSVMNRCFIDQKI